MSSAETRYDWKRFWCPREGRMASDGEGFLLDPDVNRGPVRWTDAVCFKEIDDRPCLILLGEPGIGKSDAMKELRKGAEARRAAGEEVLFVDLRFKRNPADELFGDPKFKRWQDGTSVLRLFIDSLDECAEKDIAHRLIGALHDRPLDKLRLRLACRTAELPSFLEKEFRALWRDKERIGIYELAPLRRKDVEVAAGANAEGFLAAVAQREVASLAIKPVTLRFLLRQYRPPKDLPRTRWELYREGCRILCEETSGTRRTLGVKGRPDGDARMAVAARIAAVCILGRRAAIQLDPDLGDVPEGTVMADAMAGKAERASRDDVQVDEEVVRETLRTSLFNGRGAALLGWAHQTYAEFLAAYFLHQRGLGPEDLEGVLLQGGTVVPELREVAAWLASVDAGVFQKLLREEPEVLLRSDMAMVGDAERERLVEGVLQSIEQRKLIDLHVEGYYPKLAHPRLTRQLEPRIRDRNTYFMVRRAAMSMAKACKQHELRTALADVALDGNEEPRIRVCAVSAVIRLGDDATLERIRPLAHGQIGEDPEDDLRGYTLMALWPRFMKARELFVCLTPPKQANYFGAYIGFVERQIHKHLTNDDLPEALAWLEQQAPECDPDSPLAKVSDTIVLRAWRRSKSPAILDALVRLAGVRFEHNDELVRWHKAGEAAGFHDAVKRKRFLKAFVESSQKLDRLALESQGLLHPDDLGWVLRQLAASQSSGARARWSILIHDAMSYRTLSAEVVEAILSARERYAELYDALGPFFLQEDLDDPVIQQARKQWSEAKQERINFEKRKRERRMKPSPQKRISAHLERIENGDLHAFWMLPHEMSLTPTSKGYMDIYHADLTSLPGWKRAQADVRRRIMKAAQRYILHRRAKPEFWLKKDLTYWSAVAGYRALRLLRKKKRAWFERLSPSTWQRWAPAIIGCPRILSPDTSGAHRALVEQTYRFAPEETLSTLAIIFDCENRTFDDVHITDMFVGCWDDRLGALLLAKAQDPELKPTYFGSLLMQLLRHGTAGARDYAASLLRLPLPDEPDGRARAHAAAQALLVHADDAGWSVLWPVLQADPVFGREIMLGAAEHDGQQFRPNNESLWQRLNEEHAANAYIWLEQQFPHEEDKDLFDSDAGSTAVTPRDQIAWARDALLKNLTSRGTPASVVAVERIAQTLPERDWISWALADARLITRQQTWTPLSSEQVIALQPKRAASTAKDEPSPAATSGHSPRSSSAPDPAPLFSWLHLSDIHFGHPDPTHDSGMLLILSSLEKDVERCIEKGTTKPQAILITGDIAWSGKASEYEAARRWLERLTGIVGLGFEHVFAVPGNHDVDRSIDKRDSAIQDQLKVLRQGEKPLDGALRVDVERGRLAQRMQSYLSFAAGLARPSALLLDGLTWRHRLAAHDGRQIRLVGLNTALLAADSADQGRLRLGNSQLTAGFIDERIDKDELVISLSHHPLAGGWLTDQRIVRGEVRKYAHVHLSGHVHDPDSASWRGGGGGDMTYVTAGAVHEDPRPADDPARHGYNFGAIHLSSSGGLELRVYPRRYSDKNRDFRLDIENLDDERLGYARHTLRSAR
jgi:hypothetical protein